MKTVGIKELKNNLSAYLREVRRGEHILVTDRNEVVAELREPGSGYGVPPEQKSKLDEWVERGIVRLPRQPRRPIPRPSGKALPAGQALEILDDLREDKG